jgi:hypothetical protein
VKLKTPERPYKGEAKILRFNSPISNKQIKIGLHKQRLIKLEGNEINESVVTFRLVREEQN